MKRKFIFKLKLAAGAAGVACFAACAAPIRSAESRDSASIASMTRDGGDGQRLVALIDYVSSDYGGAVKEGAVISLPEYEEQIRFLDAAKDLAAKAGTNPQDASVIGSRIAALRTAVDAKADAAEVSALGRSAREEVVQRLGLRTAPRKRPDEKAGAALYAEACAACHGLDGLGKTEVALRLDPVPTSFKDPERLAALSPYRVYNDLTLGVPGTAMPSFDSLSPDERWDLSFHVMRLGHAGEMGEALTVASLTDLSFHSDAELMTSFREKGVAAPAKALAFARLDAPYKETPLGLGIAETRALVREAATLGRSGRRDDADRRALDAYLQGFEPLEAQISAQDPKRTVQVEGAFRDFRAAIAATDERGVASTAKALDDILAQTQSSGGTTLPFAAAFLIYFREGLEAALLVGALLGSVKKLGRADAARSIHQGWIAAIAAGFLTWFLFSKLVAVSPSHRELMEAVIGLLAAVVLFGVSFWMISKAESKKWIAFLNQQMSRSLRSGSAWSLAGVSFLAVYREFAETILFTEALLLEAGSRVWPVALGAIAGAATVFLIAILVQNALKRLPMPIFFGTSGLLLSLLAITFVGSSMATFVAGGYIRPRPVSFPSIPILGIHPDASSLSLQFILAAVLVGAAVKTFVGSRVDPSPLRAHQPN